MPDWPTLMRRGDFPAAWALSDAVLRARAGAPCHHLPRHLQWAWDGGPVEGRRLLVRCYHGLGDTLMFARYLPLLRARAAHVALWAQPALLPLLADSRLADELLPLHDGPPPDGFDRHVEIMELPHLFRTTLGTIPAGIPYLRAEPAARAADGTLHAGLAWAAGDWAPARSLRFADVAPLLGVPGVTWWILQRGARLAEWDGGGARLEPGDDVRATARRMRALDLVVTPDTMPAHLAGALGVPVVTMLPREADWRWMRGRRTPWYPTMRLVRQRAEGAWEDVVERVRRLVARARVRGA